MKHDVLMQFSPSLFTDRRKIIVLKSKRRDFDLREAPHTDIHTIFVLLEEKKFKREEICRCNFKMRKMFLNK
jgi:hypothetical protein